MLIATIVPDPSSPERVTRDRTWKFFLEISPPVGGRTLGRVYPRVGCATIHPSKRFEPSLWLNPQPGPRTWLAPRSRVPRDRDPGENIVPAGCRLWQEPEGVTPVQDRAKGNRPGLLPQGGSLPAELCFVAFLNVSSGRRLAAPLDAGSPSRRGIGFVFAPPDRSILIQPSEVTSFASIPNWLCLAPFAVPGPRQSGPPDPAWAKLVCLPASGIASPPMSRPRRPGIGFVLHKEARIHPTLTL